MAGNALGEADERRKLGKIHEVVQLSIDLPIFVFIDSNPEGHRDGQVVTGSGAALQP